MMKKLQEHQKLFNETGGTHAAGIFDRQLTLLAFAEDIGRHNAFDKAMGSVILERKTSDVAAIMATSRLSYEMVQKAARGNIEILAGISGATTLGIQLAKSINMTLIGFARNGSGYIYSGPSRIINDKSVLT
jgi:FdhD protein